MRPWKIVLLVTGALLGLVGLGLAAASVTLLWANATQRDSAGYYVTPTTRLHTGTYALTSQADFGSASGDWVPAHPIGTVRIRATGVGTPVFVGVGPRSEVDHWLAGVAHARVTGLGSGSGSVTTETVTGQRAPDLPASQHFWSAAVAGRGTQTLVWPSQGGRWSAVVMNADGRPGVAVAVDVGVRTGLLLPIGLGVGGGAVLLLAGGVLLVVVGLGGDLAAGSTPNAGGVPPTAADAYPVLLDGQLDPRTSRWLWLVKWLLVVPHLVVLALLWIVVAVTTPLAGIVILVAGRYPRPLFDFNVGVFRWTWRVGFYAIDAFGTDRYPPFSLAADPTYPADFTVAYPQHLSRGLVLVKWWLLALPHYLVVAVFVGGFGFGWPEGTRVAGGISLIALLALIGVVTLAVRGRYPESVFDLVMGLNRWCFRVLAYVALMRDEYPPFRLDTGGTDPGHRPGRTPSLA